ncbi:FG-GAP-like repeat-containing protein [Streptomyces litmocidini]|uniref:FG-GAP-like repeat-containing protein n=1 Tax=Streptomyces litmocidini TaxID=67318 RepID=UPI00167C92EE|nr:FG-GAP-like repeat-containing protein [Streptomyces litmocidini]
MSYAVEDFSYPGAAAIQAEKAITLKRGDGNLMLQACDGTQDILVNTRSGLKDYCFDVKTKPAYLSLELPSAYGIWTEAYPVKTTIEADGTKTVIDAPANDFTGYGEATADRIKSSLIELRVTGTDANPPAPGGDQTLAFTGRITIGDGKRSCTATLVDPYWVLTAKHCFADNPADTSTVAAGAPKEKTTLTVGRTDLLTSGGHTTDIVELVPRADRDLVMARLDKPAFTVTPVVLSATAPTAGQDVTVAGFGRTKNEWVPSKLHSATFTTGVSDATGVLLAPKSPADATVCQGDAGGPAIRTENGKPALVGITARSGQAGCLDAANTTAGAYDVRTDDIRDWVSTLTNRRSAAVNEAGGNDRIRWADFDGDRKPDYISVADNGEVSVWLNRGGDPAGSNGWQPLGRVATGLTTDRNRVRFADFDGDGKADYFLINTDGSVEVYLNQGGDPGNGWKHIGKVAYGTTSDATKVRFADWDGDGRSDYLVFTDSGALSVYLNRGGDQSGNGWPATGTVATGVTSDRSRIRLADNDGDGKADYLHIKSDGKVDLYLNRGGDPAGGTGWNTIGQIASGVTTDHTKVQFVDFNGDTHADYVVAGAGGSASVWLWNGGDKSGPNGWTGIGKVASGT